MKTLYSFLLAVSATGAWVAAGSLPLQTGHSTATDVETPPHRPAVVDGDVNDTDPLVVEDDRAGADRADGERPNRQATDGWEASAQAKPPGSGVAELRLPALVVPRQRVSVRAGRSGIVKSTIDQVGAEVRAGQLVALIEDDVARLAVLRQQATINVAKHGVEQATAAHARVEVALQTHRPLAESGAVSQLNANQLELDCRAARANVEALKGQLLVEERNLELLNAELEKYRILAPTSGFVTRVFRFSQQYVSQGDLLFWVESRETQLRLHVPGSIPGPIESARYSLFHAGQWLPLEVGSVARSLNSDGSRTVLLELPPTATGLISHDVVDVHVHWKESPQ